MTQELKPIETLYAGEKFRSKLEARWAVFFDACGVEWEYEPEGYNLGDGVWYLPDFKLKYDTGLFDVTIYIEVKGTMRDNDAEKISRFSEAVNRLSKSGDITDFIVVGNIPKGETIDEIAEFIYKHEPPYYGIRYSSNGTKTGMRYPGIYHCTGWSVQWEYEQPPIWAKDYNTSNKMQFYIGYASELMHANASATVEAFAAARHFRFDHGGWRKRQEPIASLDTDDSWRRRWLPFYQKHAREPADLRSHCAYDNVQFSSELEMRWAVFFDKLHIKWQYHPKEFEVGCDGNDDETWHMQYTPTFWLPDIGLYAEVEPSNEQFKKDSEKLAWMVDYAGPCADGIIILGQIPLNEVQRADSYGGYYIPMFSIIYHADNALGGTFGGFIPTKDGVGFLYGDQIEREARVLYTTSSPVRFEEFESAPDMPDNVSTETAYVYAWPFEDFQSAMASAYWH